MTFWSYGVWQIVSRLARFAVIVVAILAVVLVFDGIQGLLSAALLLLLVGVPAAGFYAEAAKRCATFEDQMNAPFRAARD